MKPKFLKIIILGAVLSLACTTKVSEWVLLNFLPEDYALIYFHKEPLTQAETQQNSLIVKNIKEANIQLVSAYKNDIANPYYGLITGKNFSQDLINLMTCKT